MENNSGIKQELVEVSTSTVVPTYKVGKKLESDARKTLNRCIKDRYGKSLNELQANAAKEYEKELIKEGKIKKTKKNEDSKS